MGRREMTGELFDIEVLEQKGFGQGAQGILEDPDDFECQERVDPLLLERLIIANALG